MWQKINNILDLIVFKHSIFALPFLFTSIIVASYLKNATIFFGFKVLILGLICAICARNFAMAMNRLLDEDIDKLNPRCAKRPNIDGRIGKKLMLAFIFLNAIIFIFTSYFINTLAFWLCFPILILLATYSLFKRFSSLAHLFLGLCLGCAPIAGSVLVLAKVELYSVYLALGVCFWTAGFDVLYSLQDMNYDKKAGLFSIPARYGEKGALAFAAIFHVLAVIFWIVFSITANLGLIADIGILCSAAILFAEHKIVRADFSKINKAFFTLNGYLSIIFFIFVLVDLWI